MPLTNKVRAIHIWSPYKGNSQKANNKNFSTLYKRNLFLAKYWNFFFSRIHFYIHLYSRIVIDIFSSFFFCFALMKVFVCVGGSGRVLAIELWIKLIYFYIPEISLTLRHCLKNHNESKWKIKRRHHQQKNKKNTRIQSTQSQLKLLTKSVL